ncbi:peptidase M23 [Catellatospora methionotrophica]|uniref:peptidase M23 n=1 Tax=Catellatospora methionotrophica TaxID=121620 RepID=UPI0033E5F46B
MPPHSPRDQQHLRSDRSADSPATGRHRRDDVWQARHRRPRAGARRLLAPVLTTAALAGVGVVAILSGNARPVVVEPPTAAGLLPGNVASPAMLAASDVTSSALLHRMPQLRAAKPSAPVVKPKPKPKPQPKPKPKPKPVVRVVQLVAGMDRQQMDNAAAIVKKAQSMGLTKWAMIVGVATAMQESRLYNVASHVVPESLNYPHQGTGSDHDSIGLFQQRASGSWGSVEEIMQPQYAAGAFFRRLVQIDDWEDMSLTRAAQSVQISAFPDAYAKHEDNATLIVNALLN